MSALNSIRWLLVLLVPPTAAACSSDRARHDAGASDVPDAGRSPEGGPAKDAGTSQGDGDGGPVGGDERRVCVEVCSAGGGTCLEPTVCEADRCVFRQTTSPCAEDRDCVPAASFWEIASECTTDADCAHRAGTGEPLEACVLVGEVGRCVRMPQRAGDCEARGSQEIAWTDIEGREVTVCGRDGDLCEDGVCVPGCAEDADCSSSLRPVCDREARRCGCSETSCANANAGRLCRPDGTCGCATDADCPGPGFDRCWQGVCGCSETASCQELLPELDVVCEVPAGA